MLSILTACCLRSRWAYDFVLISMFQKSASAIACSVIRHPVILSFQSQNFILSQILPSVDIWRPLGTDFTAIQTCLQF